MGARHRILSHATENPYTNGDNRSKAFTGTGHVGAKVGNCVRPRGLTRPCARSSHAPSQPPKINKRVNESASRLLFPVPKRGAEEEFPRGETQRVIGRRCAPHSSLPIRPGQHRRRGPSSPPNACPPSRSQHRRAAHGRSPCAWSQPRHAGLRQPAGCSGRGPPPGQNPVSAGELLDARARRRRRRRWRWCRTQRRTTTVAASLVRFPAGLRPAQVSDPYAFSPAGGLPAPTVGALAAVCRERRMGDTMSRVELLEMLRDVGRFERIRRVDGRVPHRGVDVPAATPPPTGDGGGAWHQCAPDQPQHTACAHVLILQHRGGAGRVGVSSAHAPPVNTSTSRDVCPRRHRAGGRGLRSDCVGGPRAQRPRRQEEQGSTAGSAGPVHHSHTPRCVR
ncbi:hypothetical protein GA0115256_14665 [Streptomyces sp. DconLS]|nr:hypothetical protein GA0115256_14665 [Streptomyces sp. DconLS]